LHRAPQICGANTHPSTEVEHANRTINRKLGRHEQREQRVMLRHVLRNAGVVSANGRNRFARVPFHVPEPLFAREPSANDRHPTEALVNTVPNERLFVGPTRNDSDYGTAQ
jgi:hypothetical protein